MGGAAAACAAVVSNPIDIVRVRLQITESAGAASARGWGPLTAGLGPAMLYNVLLNATRFSLFAAVEEDGRAGPVAGGFMAGGVAGFVSSPLARWRTLRQAGGSGASSSLSLLMARPFAGAPAWALRNAGHTACIFHLFGATSRVLERSSPALPPTLQHLAASLFAASVSCFLMNPLDVYCTRTFHSSLEPVDAPLRAVPATPANGRTFAAAAAAGYKGLSANVRVAWTRCEPTRHFAHELCDAPRALAPSARLTCIRSRAQLLRTVPHTVLTFVILEALRARAAEPSLTPATVTTWWNGDGSEPSRRVRALARSVTT
jgi:hypothetical protein